MRRRFVTADVFTDRRFGGNPLAVVLDAEGLTGAQMQAVATEFNYSETTFILPASDPAHTAHVRIFTPSREVPFAGHPNVGTAFVLAQEAVIDGHAPPANYVFEEAAGLVAVQLLHDTSGLIGAELTSPQPLSRRGIASAEAVASMLSLDLVDVRTDRHMPQVVSVGLPFLMAELVSRDALRRVRPQPACYDAVLPLDEAHAIYAYTTDGAADDPATDLQSRMFMQRLTSEDPATGSAGAAVTALLADVRGLADIRLRIGQGVDMGRPSLLLTRAQRQASGFVAFAGGRCVRMFEGHFDL